MQNISDSLFGAIQAGEPLYDAFLGFCRENLPNDADERYQWLRGNGYVARDEADIYVYVVRVASRHWSKFQWLYDNLFINNSNVFRGEIDLVVWGCGCGLDLLALYDRAMQQNNPQLWLVVRSVTLLDVSKVALSHAKQIAELLFPCARGRIATTTCDFKSMEQIDIEAPKSFIYTPRLHLISNVVDLLSQEEIVVFVSRQKKSFARWWREKPFFNETFVAFSPEYRNWDLVDSRKKIDAFRDAWGKKATEITISDNEPKNCVYAMFSYNDYQNSMAYKLYASGNQCLRNLVRGRNRCLDEGCKDGPLAYLHSALIKKEIQGKNFFECYEWVDVQKYEKKRGDAVVDRILFVPPKGSLVAPCVIWFGWHPQNAPDPKELAWKSLLTKNGLDQNDWNRYATKTKVLCWDCNNKQFNGDTNFDDYLTDGSVDFSEAFIINPNGAVPLPSLDREMDRKQKEIILGRQQLRRIRGGAGCGKTTTMLWHGVMSVLRLHQPVLMACRTVTLFRRNQRRMAATILERVPGLEYVERRLIQFWTIDKYLCEHLKGIGNCEIRNSGERRLSDSEKRKLCCKCKDNTIYCMCNMDSGKSFMTGANSLGAVMVDEIQSVDPNMVQALYNLTEVGNPNREFYCFCDERQCLKTNALETDEVVKRLRVKTPKGTRGRAFRGDWKSLNKPYRQLGEMSGVLAEVAHEFQKLSDGKYGDDEMERPPYQPGLANVFSVERCGIDNPNWKSLENMVIEKINYMKQQKAGKVTVVCDAAETVRKLLSENNGINWLSTHAMHEAFIEEQRLRNEFEEMEGRVGLTTIELAQGWDLENVVLVITKNLWLNAVGAPSGSDIESVTTGITRAEQQLRIIDASTSGWVYEQLKRFN